jgi:hypothetical protein
VAVDEGEGGKGNVWVSPGMRGRGEKEGRTDVLLLKLSLHGHNDDSQLVSFRPVLPVARKKAESGVINSQSSAVEGGEAGQSQLE